MYPYVLIGTKASSEARSSAVFQLAYGERFTVTAISQWVQGKTFPLSDTHKHSAVEGDVGVIDLMKWVGCECQGSISIAFVLVFQAHMCNIWPRLSISFQFQSFQFHHTVSQFFFCNCSNNNLFFCLDCAQDPNTLKAINSDPQLYFYSIQLNLFYPIASIRPKWQIRHLPQRALQSTLQPSHPHRKRVRRESTKSLWRSWSRKCISCWNTAIKNSWKYSNEKIWN